MRFRGCVRYSVWPGPAITTGRPVNRRPGTGAGPVGGELIRKVFKDSDGTYGYRRVHAQLARDGVDIDDDPVRVIMRDLGLEPCQPTPFRPVTTIAGDAEAAPDLIRRDFTADAPGRTLVGDITYIATQEGWLYLATVLDCFSKKVVGYAMDRTMTADLVIAAVDMAASRVPVVRDITVFHSDRGCSICRRVSREPPRGMGFFVPWEGRECVMTMHGLSRSTGR